ncbi:MAG: hypothetical protein KAJ29_02015 [Alphaproteobacteria bacterium]|nr:hypothetical protein [Alphaproteobacteria bacterium]
MGKDKDGIVEQLTNKELEAFAKCVSDKYSDLTQKKWSLAAIKETLVDETRMSLLLDTEILKIGDNESDREELRQIITNGNLSLLVKRLGEANLLPDEALIFLRHSVILDNATRKPEDVFPACVL